MRPINPLCEEFQDQAKTALQMRPQFWADVFLVKQPSVPWGSMLLCFLWSVLSLLFFLSEGVAPLFLCSISIGLAAFQGWKTWAKWEVNESAFTRQQLEELVSHYKKSSKENRDLIK